MKLTILTLGKKHDPAIEAAITDYAARIARHIPLEWRIIPSADQKTEHATILTALEKLSPDYIIALDERGKEMNTAELAQFIDKRMGSGVRHVVLIIGGAYGLSDEIRAKAETVWSLSRLTLPHQLVRLITVEALARALSVIKG